MALPAKRGPDLPGDQQHHALTLLAQSILRESDRLLVWATTLHEQSRVACIEGLRLQQLGAQVQSRSTGLHTRKPRCYLLVQCSWCLQLMYLRPADNTPEVCISHGICPACSAKMMAGVVHTR